LNNILDLAMLDNSPSALGDAGFARVMFDPLVGKDG
jgi:hypothetical protein